MAKVGFETRAFASLFFFLLFVGFIAGGIVAVTNQGSFRLRAFRSSSVNNIQIANITENSVAIFWQTAEPTKGFISYGETTNLGKTRLDDRDRLTGEPTAYYSHMVTINNLNPKTKYYYTLGVDSNVIDHDGFPYVFFTSSSVRERLTDKTLAARVTNRDRTPGVDYIVTLSFEQQSGNTLSNTLGSVTTRGGEFSIPLTSLRTADGTKGFVLSPNENYTVDATLIDQFGKVTTQSFTYSPANIFPTLIFDKANPADEGASPIPMATQNSTNDSTINRLRSSLSELLFSGNNQTSNSTPSLPVSTAQPATLRSPLPSPSPSVKSSLQLLL